MEELLHFSLLLSTEIGSAKSPKNLTITPSQKSPSALFFYLLASFDVFEHSYCFQILSWLTTIGLSLPGVFYFLLFSHCLYLCWILGFPEYEHFFVLSASCVVHDYILCYNTNKQNVNNYIERSQRRRDCE